MKRIVCGIALAMVLAPALVWGQADPAESGAAAEVRIHLPAGTVGGVSVEPGDRHVRLVLPRGSQFPLDFASSTGGLVRSGSVAPLGDQRVQLDLELARGRLDRIEYDAASVALYFRAYTYELGNGDATHNYALGADDKIRFTVHNQPQLGASLTVTPDGLISAPLVGDVQVAGLTPRQVALKLTELLADEFLVDPQVDVEVEEYRSQWVMVSGEVALPGRKMLRGGTTLKEVLSESGGFTLSSGERITISRRDPGSGEYEVVEVERLEFEHGESDPLLYHGDIVEVGRQAYCYIHGEVRMSQRVPVERGMTLLRAISIAGGLTEWANRKSVKILYPDGANGNRVVEYNLKRIQEGKDPDPPLEGDETIIVERRFF